MKKEWHEKYEKRLVDLLQLTKKQAHEARMAGMADYDYDANPESCAEDEASYWAADNALGPLL